jgi:hypothetical protein
MNRFLLPFGAFAAVASVYGTFTVADLLAHTTQRTTFTLPARAVLDVRTDGDVVVRSTDADAITVHRTVQRGVRGPSATSVVDADQVVLSGSCPNLVANLCEVSYTVDVPAGTQLRLSSSSGDVTGLDLASTVVDASSDSGEVRLGFAAAPSHVAAHSDSDLVDIRVPADGDPYAVTARSDSDSVTVTVASDPASARTIAASSDSDEVRVHH